jgi:hypothetical protein
VLVGWDQHSYQGRLDTESSEGVSEVRHSTRTRDSSGLGMELVGLEPTTSWVRSTHPMQPDKAWVEPLFAPRPGRPNTFPNILRLVRQWDNRGRGQIGSAQVLL